MQLEDTSEGADLEALLRAGEHCLYAGQESPARLHFQRALQMTAVMENPALEVKARAALVQLDLSAGAAPDAVRHAQRCMALCQGPADTSMQARALLAQARVALNLGGTDEALINLEAALPLVEACGEPMLGYVCRNLMGIIVSELGQPEAAISWHLGARDDALRAGQARSASSALANVGGRWLDIAGRAQAQGEHDRAQHAWKNAIEACDTAEASAIATGSQTAQFVAVANRAAAWGQLGQTHLAIDGFKQAAVLAEGAGEMTGTLQMSVLVAELHLKRGDAALARAEAVAAIAQARALGTRKKLEALHAIVSGIDEAHGDLASALQHHKEMFEVHKAVAAEQAAQRAQVMAVRLETERALAEAQHERHRAHGLAQENAELAQRAVALGKEAMQDALTGLANRRRLDAALAQRHADAVSRNMPLCAALLDVDHFKHINDRHSHAVGDRVLSQVGAILRAQCRGDDLPARYGGEEFVLLFADVGPVRAADICERVRRAIHDFDWHSIAPGLAVTASFGVCNIALEAGPAEGMARVDALMYEAKAAGRNRVHAAA